MAGSRGCGAGVRKGDDLRRDPRFALHGPTFHPEEGAEAAWPGEAKIAGRALPDEATTLVVEWWTPDDGLQRAEGT